jgi:hypothetical protein
MKKIEDMKQAKRNEMLDSKEKEQAEEAYN